MSGNTYAGKPLSDHEAAALDLLAKGHVYKQIGPLLGQTYAAARVIVSRARRKLGAKTSHEAVAMHVRTVCEKEAAR